MHILRNATINDVNLVTDIMVTSFRTAFHSFVSQETLDACAKVENCREMFINIFAEGKMNVILGDSSGILVWEKDDEDIGEIVAIHSLPESWGTGLGHALLMEGLKQMKKAGIGSVYLWAFKENLRARRFYEKHGLRWDGTERISEFDGAVEVLYRIKIEA